MIVQYIKYKSDEREPKILLLCNSHNICDWEYSYLQTIEMHGLVQITNPYITSMLQTQNFWVNSKGLNSSD